MMLDLKDISTDAEFLILDALFEATGQEQEDITKWIAKAQRGEPCLSNLGLSILRTHVNAVGRQYCRLFQKLQKDNPDRVRSWMETKVKGVL